jgi:hypothetical protein
MMVSLTGQLLNPPLLRFNYASISAKDDDPRRGLNRYGPYDYQQLNKGLDFPPCGQRQTLPGQVPGIWVH